MYKSFVSRGMIASSLVVCAFLWPASARPDTPRPVGPGGSWRLVFHDEFSGNRLDTSKWNTKFWYKATDGYAFMSPNNVTVANGYANLTVTAHGSGSGSDYRPYTGAMINSYGKFRFSYGVFELRAKVPGGGGGMDTGAYLANDSGPGKDVWPPELDNMEIRSANPSLPVMTYHYMKGSTHMVANYWAKMPNLSQAFHTYTMDWEPSYIRWYIDGVLRSSFTDASKITRLPMDMIISPIVCTTSTGWCTKPSNNKIFPQRLVIGLRAGLAALSQVKTDGDWVLPSTHNASYFHHRLAACNCGPGASFRGHKPYLDHINFDPGRDQANDIRYLCDTIRH